LDEKEASWRAGMALLLSRESDSRYGFRSDEQQERLGGF
jgi:hypothetical protein